MNLWQTRWLGVRYAPDSSENSFLERAVTQRDGGLTVTASVLANRESERYFGVPLARRGIQPIWLEITNQSSEPYRLRLASLDPSYFPPLEAAYINHFHFLRRLLGFGAFALLFLPVLILLPFKLIAARMANRRMDAYFQENGLGYHRILPGATAQGFVFTTLDQGTKQFSVKLLGGLGSREFAFSLPVPGLRVDHDNRLYAEPDAEHHLIDCNDAELKKRLATLPRCTTNHLRTVEGDPANLVVIGEFETLLSGFGARWDETEAITWESCLRLVKAFMLGGTYRYSPVSSLYLFGRRQDFALQRARETINERLHLRLWLTELRFEGQPVWLGQISRDIGVRFTLKTWNLTTHKVDPDVDDARDGLLDELLESGRVALAGYVSGVDSATKDSPRHNLTGDPYFTDGHRAVVMFASGRATPQLINWV